MGMFSRRIKLIFLYYSTLIAYNTWQYLLNKPILICTVSNIAINIFQCNIKVACKERPFEANDFTES